MPLRDFVLTLEKKWKRYALISFTVILTSFILYYFSVRFFYPKTCSSNAGEFGDTFGALNTFFTALGFLVISATLFFQYRELFENRIVSRLQVLTYLIKFEIEHINNQHKIELYKLFKSDDIGIFDIPMLEEKFKEAIKWQENKGKEESFEVYDEYSSKREKHKDKDKFWGHINCFLRNLDNLIGFRKEIEQIEGRTNSLKL